MEEESFWKQAFPLLGFFRTLCHKKPPERTQKPFSNRELLLSFYFLVKAWGYLNIRRGSLDYIGFFDGRVFVVVGLSLSPFTISSSTKLPSVYNNSEGHPYEIWISKEYHSSFLRRFHNPYLMLAMLAIFSKNVTMTMV